MSKTSKCTKHQNMNKICFKSFYAYFASPNDYVKYDLVRDKLWNLIISQNSKGEGIT